MPSVWWSHKLRTTWSRCRRLWRWPGVKQCELLWTTASSGLLLCTDCTRCQGNLCCSMYWNSPLAWQRFLRMDWWKWPEGSSCRACCCCCSAVSAEEFHPIRMKSHQPVKLLCFMWIVCIKEQLMKPQNGHFLIQNMFSGIITQSALFISTVIYQTNHVWADSHYINIQQTVILQHDWAFFMQHDRVHLWHQDCLLLLEETGRTLAYWKTGLYVVRTRAATTDYCHWFTVCSAKL